jgi:hypothetical protein
LLPELHFDTYVGTTLGFAQAPVILGRAFDAGAAIVGQGQVFDVSWRAVPASGPPFGQGLEIARLSVIGGAIPDIDPRSAVFAHNDLDNPVFIPVPEPSALWLLLATAVPLARKRGPVRLPLQR